jgi:hypothetical protein
LLLLRLRPAPTATATAPIHSQPPPIRKALWLEPPAFEGLTRLALRGTRLGDAGAEALADLLAPPEAAGAHGALVQARGVAWRVAWHVVMSHDAGETSRDVARLGAARSSRHRRLARFDREQSRRPKD